MNEIVLICLPWKVIFYKFVTCRQTIKIFIRINHDCGCWRLTYSMVYPLLCCGVQGKYFLVSVSFLTSVSCVATRTQSSVIIYLIWTLTCDMCCLVEKENPGSECVGLRQGLFQRLPWGGKTWPSLATDQSGLRSPRSCLWNLFLAHYPPPIPLQVLIDLSNTAQLDNVPRWLPLKEQSEADHHRRQGRHATAKPTSQHSSPKTTASSSSSIHDVTQDSPKSSVIKSRSHGIFPDPAKGRTPTRCQPVPSFSSGLPLSVTFYHFLSASVCTISTPLNCLFSPHQPELKLHAVLFFAFCSCYGLLSFLITMLAQLSGSALDRLSSPG